MKLEQNSHQHRQENDLRMTEFFPVKFTHNGDKYNAEMNNLSIKGAHLLLKNYEPVRNILLVGEELQLDIRTPYGKSKCIAKIVWLDLQTTPVSIGLEFISLSEDANDPLRCAIASPL